MKKLGFAVLLSLVTIVGMAQPPRGGHGPEGPHGHGHGPGGHRPHVECATREQLHKTLDVLEKLDFDEKRLMVAELCVTLCKYCTDDLARMARTFSFDENRKKFLIYAHEYCNDRENYYYLRDVFDMQMNFEEMMRVVDKRRR